MDKIRVLCVDDHHVVLEGLASLIDRQADMQLIGRALSGEQGLMLFQQLAPDICLVDLRLPGMSGLDLVRELRGRDATAKIIVLTMYQGDEDIYRALENGAATYVLKDALSADLVQTIREVYQGHRDLPENVAARLAARLSYSDLTPRETQVLQLVATGLRNKEIAGALSLSEDTVKLHVKSILGKLKVHDRTAAVRLALQRGIIHLD